MAAQADAVLEDVGPERGHDVHAGELLEEIGHEGNAYAGGAGDAAVAEAVAPGALLGLEGDGVLDFLELERDVRGVGVVAAEGGEGDCCFVRAAHGAEVARRLGQEGDHGADEDAEDDLEGAGEAPLDAAGVEGHAVVEPVRDDQAHDQVAQLHRHHATAGARLRALGEPDGDDGRHVAEAETRDEAADEELREAEAGALQDGAHGDDDGAGEVVLLAPVPVAEPELEEGAEHGADFVGGDEEAEEGGVRVAERGEEGRRGCQAAHEAQVVAEEQEADRAAEGYGVDEVLALEAREGGGGGGHGG